MKRAAVVPCRFSLLTLVTLATACGGFSIFVPATLVAQDDPFAEAGGAGDIFGGGDLDFGAPTGGADTTDAISDLTTEAELSPLVAQLIQLATKGPIDRAKAINSLAKIGRWNEVNQALNQLDLAKTPASAQAEMGRLIGPSQYIRINQEASVSDEAKAKLQALAKAANEYTTSDKRLDAAILDLSSTSETKRLAAARTLFEGGNAAIRQITNRIISLDPNQDTSETRNKLLRVLRRFDGQAMAPLQRHALYGERQQRARAAAALASIGDRNFIADYVAAAFAADSLDFERQAGMRAITRLHGKSISNGAAIRFLIDDLAGKRQMAQSVPRGQAIETCWSCSSVGCEDLQIIETTSFLSAYRDAVDAAARLKRVANLTPELASLVLATEVEYRIAVDSDWGMASEVDQLAQSLPFEFDDSLLDQTLSSAVQNQNEILSLGMVRLIAEIRATSPSVTGYADPLLLTGMSSPSSLVQLATSAHPRVRYEAAILVSKLAGSEAYPGSSEVRRTLSEMVGLQDRPAAILVETRPDVILQMEQILTDLGYDVTVVPDVNRLQRAIRKGGDLRLILSKMQLSDLPPVELLDIVRRSPRARNVPVVFFGDHDLSLQTSIRENRWDATTVQMATPRTVAAFDPLNESVGRLSQFDSLSTLDRRMLRQQAIEQLDLDR
ncbi:hypothetical protein Pla22_17390 [Rubripirellula amarantea]|uniref:Response regulatory domain-containing protein n=1 Tax=Rubripirellula amarantea TaxID=2527999 RepID=A0A5C5WT52_9BACT|nr:hypothetical protein [Rubripirellula amarantea]TWT54104.1 hypothetical protein Pla22_17390 [Rubripirellula amarantea]